MNERLEAIINLINNSIWGDYPHWIKGLLKPSASNFSFQSKIVIGNGIYTRNFKRFALFEIDDRGLANSDEYRALRNVDMEFIEDFEQE
jgi:hypothetical protein